MLDFLINSVNNKPYKLVIIDGIFCLKLNGNSINHIMIYQKIRKLALLINNNIEKSKNINNKNNSILIFLLNFHIYHYDINNNSEQNFSIHNFDVVLDHSIKYKYYIKEENNNDNTNIEHLCSVVTATVLSSDIEVKIIKYTSLKYPENRQKICYKSK